MIREIRCDKVLDFEYPPDGGKVPVIDPYDGCQLNCAYCFQWEDEHWNKDILVKTNFPEEAASELESWDKSEPIYLGSKGDPYMRLEEKYQLTRKTLQVLCDLGIRCFINTKSDSNAFRRDFDIFLEFGDRLTICVGQTNLRHLREVADQGKLPNIKMANALIELGIDTWVFITPVLPGITDVEAMIDALPNQTPVYLDQVRLKKDDRRFFDYIRRYYPGLVNRYQRLAKKDHDPYYDELTRLYGREERISFVFGAP